MDSADESPPQPTESPPPARRWVLIVVLVPLAAFLICGGICAGIFLVFVRGIKETAPYEMALEQVQHDPQVVERLGEPVEDATWFPTGNVSVNKRFDADGQTAEQSGQARLDFDVAGPNGRAHVRTQARMIDGIWGLTRVEVTFDDGERILLDIGPGEGLGEAPRWSPEEEGEAEVSPEPGELDWSPENIPTLPEEMDLPSPPQ